ncbi:putative B3 domain-containing protein Os03g0621600 [Argentina anserina]|uniref:putative B3 domain-containing protein Os03g0621600 n=1 Tax=Argentina anserina TaxID=57926 RepID=UPI0021768166|nr:putative B3 domain-containing protein Os03g0621600 [Potentilla anserina]
MGSCSRRTEDGYSKFPGFYECVDDSVLRVGMLKIPEEFCENFEGKVPQRCLLHSLSGIWPVDVKGLGGELFLEKGWNQFSVGNRLKIDEFVVFHYIERAKFLVEIYGHDHCSKMSRARESNGLLVDHDVINIDSDSVTTMSLVSETESPRESTSAKRLSKRRRRRNNVATTSSSGNPCFSVEMSETHLSKGPLLTPRSFMRNMHKPDYVTLKVGSRPWNVNWIHSYEKSSRFSGGWRQFASQNKLQKGDVCNFELISKTNEIAVLKVSITKMYA